MSIKPATRFIGTQYFRHPNPPLEDWDRDMALIRDSGLQVVRTWLYWQRTHPRPETWDFSDYDRFVESAVRHGLHVLIQLIPECAPQWFIHEHPDAQLRHHDGKTEPPKPVGMAMVGGYPALCPDVPAVREEVGEFIQRTARRYRDCAELVAIDVWNELMPYYFYPTPVYHPATQEKYRAWLRDRYGTIEAMNEAFGGWRFTDFSQVTPSAIGDYVDELHWNQFTRDWITGQLRWRRDLIKAEAGHIPVATHNAGFLEHVVRAPFDNWDLADVVDIWGASDYIDEYYPSAAYLCGIASASGGKPWWLAEQTGGRVWGLYGHAVRTPEFLTQKMITAFAYGATGNLCWQWRPERLGTESPNFGVVNEDGSPNEGTQGIARLARSLNRHADAWEEFTPEPPDVGLVMDWRTRSWEWVAFRDASKAGEPELLGYFKALTDIGANIEFVHLERMARDGIDPKYRVLIMPLCFQDAGPLQERLEAFVKGGGTVIAGPYFLVYRENCFVYEQVPPPAMQSLFGGRRNRLTYPPQKPPGFEPTTVTFVPSATGLPMDVAGRHVVEIHACEGATPIAQQGDEVAGTRHEVGRGRAYRIGTFLGMAYDRAGNPGLARWLDRVLDEAGCGRFPMATGTAVVRGARIGDDRLLFVANTAGEPTSAWFSLGGAPRAEDLVSGEVLEAGTDGQLRVALRAHESLILRVRAV